MKFKLFEGLLGKKKKKAEPLAETDSVADALLKQIMQPDIICDHCFFDNRESNVTVDGNDITCYTCQNKLEQIIMTDKGAQLAFYLPARWSEEEKQKWVEAWKGKNFTN